MAPSTPPPDGSSPSLPIDSSTTPPREEEPSLKNLTPNSHLDIEGKSLKDRVAPMSAEDHPSLSEIQTVFEHYLDENHLMKGSSKYEPIQSFHLDWFLNQAVVLEYLDKADPAMKAKLSLIALHAYTKAASIGSDVAEDYDIQTTPFLAESTKYHRTSTSTLLNKIDKAFSADMGIKQNQMMLVDGPFFKEVFRREFSFTLIESIEDFNSVINIALTALSNGKFLKELVIFDISPLTTGKNPQEIIALAKTLEKSFVSALEAHLKTYPYSNIEEIAEKLVARVQLLAFSQHKGETVLIVPEFLQSSFPHSPAISRLLENKHSNVLRSLIISIRDSGFRVSIDHAKEIWLKVKDIHAIFEEEKLPVTTLATKEGPIPTIYRNYKDFFSQPIVGKFLVLSSDAKKAPYITVMAKATVDLLKGFLDYRTEAGGIDAFFEKHGLSDLLQIFYFAIHNSMATAILYQDDLLKFVGELDRIHQGIQNILAIIEPYDEKAFSKSVITRLTSGDPPFIPKTLGKPKAYLKSSGMHAFSSILSCVEKEKKSPSLNVAVLNDSYYEATKELKRARNYKFFTFNGDRFNTKGIEGAFTTSPEPIDLFVCEFHHNISETRHSYTKEDLLRQIKAMHANGMLAKKCTIAIDTTINLEKSPDFQELLSDPLIQNLIKTGALNIVFFRSAQKFDMLGMDNYSGGIAITVNNDRSFNNFNARMNQRDDQLKGLSYQGLTHLNLYGSDSIENYRSAIMHNLQFLYSKLPPNAIWRENSTNPMQISEVKDNELVFLDIKFPDSPKTHDSFISKLNQFTIRNKLSLSSRASFGFITTNLVMLLGGKLRLTPGLDSEASLNKYVAFFQAIQKVIETTLRANPTLSGKELDQAVAKAINMLNISTITTS